ncbi:MAG: hypothetical protein AAGG44_06060, partial [Planctomycetota bacterium]
NTITKMLVMDMETPGEIDTEEGNWLGTLFDQYSVGNATESRLCKEIKETTTKIEGKIQERFGS